jgi:hypothetical protein
MNKFAAKYADSGIIKVRTFKDYVDLPAKERTSKYGMYLVPVALPHDDWDEFNKFVSKEFPWQYFFRHWLTSFDNPAYAFYSINRRRIQEFYFDVRAFISPRHKRFRKAYPRHAYLDLDSIIVKSLFGLILDFWYDESMIDDSYPEELDEKQREIYNWLKYAVYYIEGIHPKKHEEIKYLYELRGQLKDFEAKVKVTNKINGVKDEIRDEETKILTKFIEYRGSLWF